MMLSWAEVGVEASYRKKVTLAEPKKNEWGSLGCPRA